jgi:hypothetical protein
LPSPLFPLQILAGLPQTDGLIALKGPAPAGSLAVSALDNRAMTFTELYAEDALAGKVTLLNFGSYS